jgi:hypothetical protein
MLCAQVFPQLYLPVMEEGNARVLRPYRKYIPSPSWWAFRNRMKQLNAFLLNVIRQRWAARQAGQVAEKMDILDRILQSIEVRKPVYEHHHVQAWSLSALRRRTAVITDYLVAERLLWGLYNLVDVQRKRYAQWG